MTQSGQPGAPPPPSSPPPEWQQAPQPPSNPPPVGQSPMASGMPAWTGNLTSTVPVAGPAGYFYADVPNRFIAMLIDVIAMVIILVIMSSITVGIFGTDLGFGIRVVSMTSLLVASIITYAIWAGYFIYTWSAMRGTLGMRLLGMQIGHESDGRSINYNQAAIRFGVLFGPTILAGLLGAFATTNVLGWIGFLWLIVILVTMAQSPTKQGIHDKYANTMVVKAGRAAA